MTFLRYCTATVSRQVPVIAEVPNTHFPQTSKKTRPLPDDMIPWAGEEVKLGMDTSTLVLQVGGLHTQVLCVLGMLCDPAQKPLVALVLAGHLQGDHVVPAEGDHPQLGTLPGYGHRRAQPHQPEASSKVGVVLQSSQEVRQRHSLNSLETPRHTNTSTTQGQSETQPTQNEFT